ncbi:hypothetical protein BOTCAL_0699g00050 [Botryotinia calthae]|uniref:Uncharacterized protein n=1 Tax=Botryotinia calthae TaxID=38488 RepID=A0A4Y8CIW0_9HELO|nr:hypothetical protein BOTCAL_0699g00050 [Botryotinia calthae]
MPRSEEFHDQEPLMGLFPEEKSSSHSETDSSVSRKWNSLFIKTKFGVHCTIVLFYFICGAFILGIQKRPVEEPRCPQSGLSTAKIEYRPQIMPNFLHSNYAGRNHHVVDLQWHDLLDNISLRATDEEMARNHNHPSSVYLSEGGGQLVWMEVSHQLHCVKMLRQWSYRDVYFASADEMTMLKMSRHIDHCLEMLRQVLMCRPDTSLTTFMWVNSQDKPILNIDPFERECVDWELLIDSVKERVVSLEEVEALRNPLHVLQAEQDREDAHITLPLGSSAHEST